MLKFSEIFEFSSENSWILKEFWPNSDRKSSNGSVPRRSNLSTQAAGGTALLRCAAKRCDPTVSGQSAPSADFSCAPDEQTKIYIWWLRSSMYSYESEIDLMISNINVFGNCRRCRYSIRCVRSPCPDALEPSRKWSKYYSCCQHIAHDRGRRDFAANHGTQKAKGSNRKVLSKKYQAELSTSIHFS